MRTIQAMALVSAAFFGTAPIGRANEHESARELVEQAIKAHGGEEALNKSRMLSRSGTGTMNMSGSTLPFTEETLLALPDRCRMAMDLDKRYQVTLIVNGDKGWQATGGVVLELSKERIEEIREEAYILWLATLTPLKNESFTLSTLPDTKVDGAPAAGVKVCAKGHLEAKLYFDRQSHLLVKIERRAREAGLLLDKTYLFGDYKDVDGAKLPLRQTELLNGKKVTERTSATYKLLRRVDDAAFSKP